MRKHQYKYGYRVRQEDEVYVTTGLWDFASHYEQTHPNAAHQAAQNKWSVPAQGQRNATKFPSYYNNFEVQHVYQLTVSNYPHTFDLLDSNLLFPAGCR